MLIALTTETYPPDINGVAMTLQRLVTGLSARNDSVQIVRPRRSKSERALQKPQEFLAPSLPIPVYRSLRFGLPCQKALLEFWQKERPDVVHIATEGPLGWSALMAGRRLGIPTVSSYHTNFDQYGKHYGFGLLHRGVLGYLRCFHNLTRDTFVPTELLRNRLERSGFRNLEILGRGVDTDLFSPAKREPGLRRQWAASESDLACLYVGRLAGEKNLPLAIDAFVRIRQLQSSARFVLVGDGPLRKKLERAHPDFIFVGYQQHEALAAHYASADLFLFPSLTETFGNVIMEATASGLPLIAFRNGAAAQHLIHGTSALLASMNDPRAFVDLASQAASSPALRRRLGAAARQVTLNFGWAEIISQYRRCLGRIVQASPNPETLRKRELSSLQPSLNPPRLKSS